MELLLDDSVPLVFGGNVFGWTADRETSFAVLDHYVSHGGSLVDTADSYSQWVPGNSGGESETILGAWLAERGERDRVRIATKVGQFHRRRGLSGDNIRAAIEDSLERLGRSSVELYYAHFDEEERPIEEIARSFSRLREEGLIDEIGVSNFSVERIAAWLDVAEREGLHAPTVIQKEYSLMERGIEADVVPLARERGLTIMTYYSLARGFLTGKYRDGAACVDSPRAGAAAGVPGRPRSGGLAALDDIAARHGCSVTAVALAWLGTRPQVSGVIASARNTEQRDALIEASRVRLSEADVSRLDAVS